MPYVNLKLGDKVIVTVTGVIETTGLADEGGQYLKLRHGEGGQLLSTIFIDDDSVDIAFDEDKPAIVLGRSVSCDRGCHYGNNDFDCPIHGGMQGGGLDA